MPCPHNEITIVQRSQQQSAVAAAAYQSGEKLFCEYDQEVKHYPEKRGIVHNEILLPANAPRSYADRNTLWNAAETVEKQWNSQLARRWVLTIPREIPPDQYAVLVREFCEQQFVSKGMIADFAIHDPHPPGHNPHAHVMLTMRAMDEHGKWLPKSRKVYDLDENGERIKLPSGRWKSHKEDTVDWNDQKYCEIWRHEWEVIQNRYLEANDRPERVDLRSYARQGLDIIPTVHEGAAVRQMEKRGMLETSLVSLCMKIMSVLITVVLYGRMIEIYLYCSVSPIPFATMTNREWGQIGNNYLKGLFALGFQGFLIMICVGIYAVLVNNMVIADNLHTAIFSIAAYTVLLCFNLLKSGALAKSLFHAH